MKVRNILLICAIDFIFFIDLRYYYLWYELLDK